MITKVAAQVDGGACTTYVGPKGAGNFVKMVHNGIEYGDMQLIAEAYDVLRTIGGLTAAELADVFAAYNRGKLESFLIEITAQIFTTPDDGQVKGQEKKAEGGALVDVILDKTGMKGTGKWTVQQAADLSVAAPVIESALDARFLSGLKEERVAAEAFYATKGVAPTLPPAKALPEDEKQALVQDVEAALYAAKICSYAQGMNIIRAKSAEQDWGIQVSLGCGCGCGCGLGCGLGCGCGLGLGDPGIVGA